MKLSIRRSCPEATSFRAACVQSMFNCDADQGRHFSLDAELPIDANPWQIGLVVGRSGSGKSSIAAELWPDVPVFSPRWSDRLPIIDQIAPASSFEDVVGVLSAVGLGTVPSWLRPFRVLSQGEQFRATLARLLAERPARAKLDEFTSVVDRQVARVGAMAFGKAWRRGPGQVVLFTCHDDVEPWLQPDWVFNTSTGEFAGRWLRRWTPRPRPSFELAIHETDWRYWPMFEPHHYLKLPRMIGATCYVGTVNGTPVAHVGVSTRAGLCEARACRLVVMPEWQGAGVGMRFLNSVAQRWLDGKNRYRLRMATLFHTTHPGLVAALRRDDQWAQVSAHLHGESGQRSRESLARWKQSRAQSNHGGHFRAIQGFRYYGRAAA